MRSYAIIQHMGTDHLHVAAITLPCLDGIDILIAVSSSSFGLQAVHYGAA